MNTMKNIWTAAYLVPWLAVVAVAVVSMKAWARITGKTPRLLALYAAEMDEFDRSL